MEMLRIGDIVTRKSYGGDIDFKIADITASRNSGKKTYVLKGILFRIIADSDEDDLEWRSLDQANRDLQRNLTATGRHSMSWGFSPFQIFQHVRGKSGTILHVDSSASFLEMCQRYYRDAKIKVYGHVIPESEQPGQIRSMLTSTQADVLVVTGHDGLKKNVTNLNSLDSYRNSRYYIQSVQEARKHEPNMNKLCIFSGACQSYYKGIMEAGANFASSPGRILIHALDPAKVGDRVALTDSRVFVTPDLIARLTQSGSKGIGGIKTRGHYIIR